MNSINSDWITKEKLFKGINLISEVLNDNKLEGLLDVYLTNSKNQTVIFDVFSNCDKMEIENEYSFKYSKHLDNLKYFADKIIKKDYNDADIEAFKHAEKIIMQKSNSHYLQSTANAILSNLIKNDIDVQKLFGWE